MNRNLLNKDTIIQSFPHIVESSIHRTQGVFYAIDELEDREVLLIFDPTSPLGIPKQNGDISYRECNLSHETAVFLRQTFSFTKPIPVLGKPRSFGLGDRLGLAGPGHLSILKEYDAYPVLAQQSMRELTLTNRTYEDVLDAATHAVFRMGYHDGFGADGDHLKTIKDIQHVLDIGYTMITLDCSDYIHSYENKTDVMIPKSIRSMYLNRHFSIGENTIEFTEKTLHHAYVVYHDAIGYVIRVYKTCILPNENTINFELSIDETQTPTTVEDHFFIAHELRYNNISLDSLAPRFLGEFQKGIDYIGDIDAFQKELKIHAKIAKYFGYKISIHSGSDKFSIFSIIGEQTNGLFHVKTAGTNWLIAMQLVARVNPKLYRKIHTFAIEIFSKATTLYHVTTDLSRIPDISKLSDSELERLFVHPDARQLIHITYGYILTYQCKGDYVFKDQLYRLWYDHHQEYADMLHNHIGNHLRLLYERIQ